MLKRLFSTIVVLLIVVTMWAQQTERLYLSGKGPEDAKQWRFFCSAGMNANKWSSIAVPSCWELQGFGKYDYGFAKDSVRGKENGIYQYSFTVPANWKQSTINIVFEGVMTDADVFINGKSAGPIHQGAFYTFRYDISKLLRYQQTNLLEVRVAKHSSNTSVNEAERKADYWIFGGIFRPVFLEKLPNTHLSQLAINATASGNYTATFEVSNTFDSVQANIIDANGKQVGSSSISNQKNEKANYQISGQITSPQTWNSETPYLYQMNLDVFKAGKIVHSVQQKLGFRTVSLRPRDGLYLNGVKIKIKGVNRSPFRPSFGRTLSKQQSIEDVLLIKSMNMNAVRCSHYPPDKHFLEACDSLGLLVMDELGGWHGYYDTPTGKKVLKEMIGEDQLHPSVIMWANGNEGGHNTELDAYFNEYDIQQRPVLHPWQLYNGVETQHYREYNYGIANFENGNDLVMPTEFLHGQFDGGHGAGLEDYWEKMWREPLSIGGFLWDLADQAVVRKDKNDSLDTDKFRAADGIVGPHHEKEGSYFTIKEVWSPIFFERREITAGFDKMLILQNRYHFTNSNTCTYSWQLKKWIGSDSSVINGSAIAPDIAPLHHGKLSLPLPDNWFNYDVLYITVHDAYQQELFTWSFPISSPIRISQATVSTTSNNTIISPLADTNLIIVKVKDLTLYFDETKGLLRYVSNKKGEIPFNNGPILEEGQNNFKGIKKYMEGDQLIITSTFDKKESYNQLKWTVYPSGWIKMEVAYFPGAYFTHFAGVNFSFPEKEIRALSYMGAGPYRVWKNRMKGGRFGVWNKTYNNSETGEAPWLYPEFKGYHADFYKGTFYTSNNQFSVVTENENLFLRLFTPAWKTDQWHNYEPMFPSGDISFMQGISSIGSKTQRNETTGPMGMKNIFYDYEKDPSRALKMVLYFNFNE